MSSLDLYHLSLASRRPPARCSGKCNHLAGLRALPARQRRSDRLLLSKVRAGPEQDLQAEMSQVEAALTQRQLEMADCAVREDYSGAATARDAAQLLELHLRDLQLKKEHEDRTTVRHRLGHVITHRRYKYKGVIAGFSHECEATDLWCKIMKIDSLTLGRRQPFYNVLVDNRDRPGGQTTYVAQENIIPAEDPQPIQHPLVEAYFTEFRDGQYTPTYTLRSQYPQQPF